MTKPKIFYLSIATLISPLFAFAQEWDTSVSSDVVAYASIFTGNFSLLLSIVIGIIATIFVFRAARKMGGGLFGSVMNYIGIGMALVVLGTIFSIALDILAVTGLWSGVFNTVCFASGYIFMVIGANKLLKGIINT